jgi:hypothetical protein
MLLSVKEVYGKLQSPWNALHVTLLGRKYGSTEGKRLTGSCSLDFYLFKETLVQHTTNATIL